MDSTFIRTYSRIIGLIVLAMGLLFFDFFTKAYVFHVLPFYDACLNVACRDIPVFYNFLGIDFLISLAINRGAAWGFFADFQFFLVVVRLLAILGMFIYLFFINQNRYVILPLLLIIAGATGNIVDFFLYGFVVDFLHFNLWGYHFPIFNFADTYITIGVIWLFVIAICKIGTPCNKRLK